MKDRLSPIVAHLLVASLVGLSPGQEPTPRLTSRFAKDHLMLTLPVMVNGQRCVFEVNFGYWTTILDSRLQDHWVPADETMRGGLGEYAEYEGFPELCVPPPMTVEGTEGGSIPFPPNRAVAHTDLSPRRESSGIDIQGILGMDFLESHALRIDFAEGTLWLLDSATLSSDQHEAKIAMKAPNRRPQVRVRSHDVSYWASVGSSDPVSHQIEHELYEYLIEEDQLRVIATDREDNDEGQARRWTYETRETGRLRELHVGPFAHHHLVVCSSSRGQLGIFYWRRYRCTFDFPGEALYLDKGPYYDLRDDSDGAGIRFAEERDSEPGRRVVSVNLDGEGHRQGVRVGDRLISIDGDAVADDELFHAIYLRLAFRPGPRELVLEREGSEVRVTIPAIARQPEKTVWPETVPANAAN